METEGERERYRVAKTESEKQHTHCRREREREGEREGSSSNLPAFARANFLTTLWLPKESKCETLYAMGMGMAMEMRTGKGELWRLPPSPIRLKMANGNSMPAVDCLY